MASLRNFVSALVLCAVLAVTLGQIQHSSGYTNQNEAHQNQIRFRRQAVDDVEQENTILQDPNQENAAEEEEEHEDAVQEDNDQVDAGEDNQEHEENDPESEENEVASTNNNQDNQEQEENNTESVSTVVQEENVTEDIVAETIPALRYPFWTTCDFGIQPIKSCYDCNSLVICKRVGGLVKLCGNPFRPYCNNGICSPVPSAECA